VNVRRRYLALEGVCVLILAVALYLFLPPWPEARIRSDIETLASSGKPSAYL